MTTAESPEPGRSGTHRALGRPTTLDKGRSWWQSPMRDRTHQRRLFRDRPTAVAAVATSALLTVLELTDVLSRTDPDDDVRDQKSSVWFGAAMATAITGSIVTLRASRPIPRHRRTWWAGLGLVWTGAIVNRLARRQLGENYRSRVTVVPAHEVVHTGLYRHVRHPMYSGSILICGGIAMALTAPASALWVLPILSLIHRIRIEEAALHAALGSDYARYRRGRARLIPKIW